MKNLKKYLVTVTSILFFASSVSAQLQGGRLEQIRKTTVRLAPLPAENPADKSLGFFDNSLTHPAYDLVSNANDSIDIEIYEMEDPKFRQLILEAIEKRNVKVRIIKETATVADNCNELTPINITDKPDCKEEKVFVSQFRQLGGTYQFFSDSTLCGVLGKNCYLHGKLLIADGKKALISTGNFSPSSFCGGLDFMDTKPAACNRDYSFVTAQPNIVKKLKEIFERDLIARTYDVRKVVQGSEKKDSLTVSPVGSDALLALINSAKGKIVISTQYIKEPNFNLELIKIANEKKVKIKILVLDLCYFGTTQYSPNAKLADKAIFDAFQQAGIEVNFFTKNIKVQGKSGYLHAKAIVVDEKTAWIGSINNSGDSFFKNREFGVFFNGAKDVFNITNSIYNDLKNPGALTWMQEKNKCSI